MNLKKLHAKAKLKGKIEIEDKKVLTAKFRLSYPNLFTAKEYEGKFSWGCTMIFSKDTDISPLLIAAQNACIEKWGSDVSKWPSKKQRSKKDPKKVISISTLRSPFRDGDIEKPDKEEYENTIFIGASCKKNQPGVCDYPDRNPITSEAEIKAGDWCRATLIANAYDEGSEGVSFVLMNVQKLQNGKGFGGGRNAAQDFADAEDVELEEEEFDEDGESSEEESEEDDTPEY